MAKAIKTKSVVQYTLTLDEDEAAVVMALTYVAGGSATESIYDALAAAGCVTEDLEVYDDNTDEPLDNITVK